MDDTLWCISLLLWLAWSKLIQWGWCEQKEEDEEEDEDTNDSDEDPSQTEGDWRPVLPQQGRGCHKLQGCSGDDKSSSGTFCRKIGLWR